MVSMRNKLGSILWGLAFIAVGVGLAGNVFGIWNFELFFDGWWTLLIIIPCVISMIQTGFNTGNVIGGLIGLVLLLSCQGVVDVDKVWKLIVPVLLIVVGVKIIFKRQQPVNIPCDAARVITQIFGSFLGRQIYCRQYGGI